MVLGFFETFQSAPTKRVIEVKIGWSRDMMMDEEFRSLMSDVKDFGDQVEVDFKYYANF